MRYPLRHFAVLGLAFACAGNSGNPDAFPKGFLFGTAIAGFQVDMGCPTLPAEQCEDRHSDWYAYVTNPDLSGDSSLHLSGQPPSKGPGFFELYPQDLDRASKELHSNSLRLSLEWSRIFPTSTVGIDGQDALRQAASQEALAFYHSVFAAMKARGLKPLVTINHYTLPSWIHDAVGCHKDLATCSPRGWLDKDLTVREIAKYAGFVAKEFGGEVDQWATLNEPFTAVALAGYLFPSEVRTHPPGLSFKIPETRAVVWAMVEAHARMYDAVHANDTEDADGDGQPARVGIVYNLQAVAPKNPHGDLDKRATVNLLYLMNDVFLNAVIHGDVDENFDKQIVHRDDLANRMDYLGINYYVRLVTEGLDSSLAPDLSPLLTANMLTLQYDMHYAKGLYEVLMDAKKHGVPLVVTETGAEDPNDDETGAGWVVQTNSWVRRAIRDGAPVEGYFYWSLLDNYEWNHGMNIKFGLYAVNPDDPAKPRVARKGAAVFGRIASENAVPPDLAARYPVE